MGSDQIAKVGAATGALGGAAIGGALDDSVQYPEVSLNELTVRGLAEEMGISIEDVASYNRITDKVNLFASVSGRSPESIVKFLNELDEETLPKGIKYFGAQVAEANKFVKARKDAIKAGKKEFEVDGKVYKITGDTSQELEEGLNFLEDVIELDSIMERGNLTPKHSGTGHEDYIKQQALKQFGADGPNTSVVPPEFQGNEETWAED